MKQNVHLSSLTVVLLWPEGWVVCKMTFEKTSCCLNFLKLRGRTKWKKEIRGSREKMGGTSCQEIDENSSVQKGQRALLSVPILGKEEQPIYEENYSPG